MNFSKAAKRHEDQAKAFAHIKRPKLASYHLRRAEVLRIAKRIKREAREVIDMDDCEEVYGEPSSA